MLLLLLNDQNMTDYFESIVQNATEDEFKPSNIKKWDNNSNEGLPQKQVQPSERVLRPESSRSVRVTFLKDIDLSKKPRNRLKLNRKTKVITKKQHKPVVVEMTKDECANDSFRSETVLSDSEYKPPVKNRVCSRLRRKHKKSERRRKGRPVKEELERNPFRNNNPCFPKTYDDVPDESSCLKKTVSDLKWKIDSNDGLETMSIGDSLLEVDRKLNELGLRREVISGRGSCRIEALHASMHKNISIKDMHLANSKVDKKVNYLRTHVPEYSYLKRDPRLDHTSTKRRYEMVEEGISSEVQFMFLTALIRKNIHVYNFDSKTMELGNVTTYEVCDKSLTEELCGSLQLELKPSLECIRLLYIDSYHFDALFPI